MKIRNYFNIILIILWMLVIFNFSNQSGTSSSGLSNKIIINIAELFNKELTDNKKDELIDKYKLLVRKTAHFGAYFILGTLIIIFYLDTKGIVKKSYIISSAISMIYAISDEIHQLFIPGRNGSIIDILIDSIGALTAITLIYLITKIIKKSTKK